MSLHIPSSRPTHIDPIDDAMQELREQLELMFGTRLIAVSFGQTTLGDYEDDDGASRTLFVLNGRIADAGPEELAHAEVALFEYLVSHAEPVAARDITLNLTAGNG